MTVSFSDWRRVVLPLLWLGVIFGSANAQVPRTIAFQGLLTDDQGAVLASGDYDISFRLYNVATDGAALWTEVQSVTVVDGVGNATLGRINPLTLPFDVPYWLGITLQQGGLELSPRIPLASGPYALMAAAVPDGSITADKIADGAITTAKIQEDGLSGSAIADGSITPGKLADGAITAVKMGDDAVGTGAILDGSITADDMAPDAIVASAIASGAVTPAKLNTSQASTGEALVFNGSSLVWGAPSGSGVISEVAAGAGLTGGGTGGIVTLSVDTDAITADMIGEDAVGNSELGVDAVATENIVDGAVTREKLDRNTAVSGQVLSFNGTDVVWAAPSVPDNSITEAKLFDGAVTATKIAGEAVGSSQLAPGAVMSSNLGSEVVTQSKLGNDAVTTVKLIDDAVTAPKIVDGGVTMPKINTSSATADDVIRYSGSQVEWGPVAVADGSIDSDKLADDAVTEAKILNAAVTADKIGAEAVGSSQVANGAITNAKIGGFLSLDKLSTLGADEGEVITFSGGVVDWAPGSALSASKNVTIDGDLTVTGSVEKGGGTFRIDHPLDPENRFLYHSFVESDEMMNVYSGNVVVGDDGSVWVQMPSWFEALNKEFRYQLTCVGGYAPVYVAQPVVDGRFQIAGGQPGLEVSWQVTAVRDDAWARQHRMRVEVDKPAEARGTLLHPEAYEK